MKESLPGHSSENSQTDRIQYSKFHEEDQKLMKSRGWDYQNEELELNKLKTQIERLEDGMLSEQELGDKNNALWLWYHHGSQVAYSKYHDNKTAIEFIDKALEYGEKIGLDNQITPLLRLLYTGDLVQARAFAESIPEKVLEKNADGIEEEIDNPERETGLALVAHFEQLETK